jgi:hypothetical protein
LPIQNNPGSPKNPEIGQRHLKKSIDSHSYEYSNIQEGKLPFEELQASIPRFEEAVIPS